MSYVRSCVHCYRMFSLTNSHNDGLCPSCREGHDRLEAECHERVNPVAAMMQARNALNRLKERAEIFPPMSLRQVIFWLLRHPHVRIMGPTRRDAQATTRDEAFVRFEDGSLWFRGTEGESCIPVHCIRTEAAAHSETGMEFDATGFVITKFGIAIRVEYLP